MITVRYEEYHNDYCRKDHVQRFANLKELEDWMFGQMKQDYSDKENGWLRMSFPVREEPCRIEFIPEWGGVAFWIHHIESEQGIIFTDGRHTAGQKHWSQETQDWLKRCKERQYAPKFVFTE